MSRFRSSVGILTLSGCLAVGLWASRQPPRPALLPTVPPIPKRDLPGDNPPISSSDDNHDALILAAISEETLTDAGITPRKLTQDETSPAEDPDHPVRRLIARELSHASDEERQIWFEELKHLPLNAVEDLLKIRRQSTPLTDGPAPPQRMPNSSFHKEPAKLTLSHETQIALRRYRAVVLLNLLNVDTVGYRCLEPCLGAFPIETADADQSVIDGLRWLGTRLKLSQGLMETTDRALDVAIAGAGWFVVEDADGTLGFTRNGAFQMNDRRSLELMTAAGPRVLQPTITLPANVTQVFIDSNGSVYGRIEGKSFENSPVLGPILLARFFDDNAMELKNDGLYHPLPQAGEMRRLPPGEQCGSLREGMLERANVNAEAQQQTLQRIEKWLADDSAYSPATTNGAQQ